MGKIRFCEAVKTDCKNYLNGECLCVLEKCRNQVDIDTKDNNALKMQAVTIQYMGAVLGELHKLNTKQK